MAEILVKAIDSVHSDSAKDTRGSFKRGMPVVVMDDGHTWGSQEGLPKFVVLKFPLITKSRIEKYISNYESGTEKIRPRLWQIRWADLPAAARNKLANSGELIIKATASYNGPSDYTWAQVKGYFRNLLTNTDETADI